LRVDTYMHVVRDVLDGLEHSGFRRIVLVNGHGGNSTVEALAIEWMADHPHVQVKFHNWWNAPRTWAKVQEIDPMGSHASWMENFPWTRLPDVDAPSDQKLLPDRTGMARPVGQAMRNLIGDGNFGGYYERPDEEMLEIWAAAVEETRQLIAEGWD
jgi:creatinine amidohydrolase